MMSVAEVAKELGVTADQVRALIHARRLRAYNFSRSATVPRYRVKPADLERFLEVAAILPEPRASTQAKGRREPDAEMMANAEARLTRSAGQELAILLGRTPARARGAAAKAAKGSR
jgi:excisionase family DNA binding protein